MHNDNTNFPHIDKNIGHTNIQYSYTHSNLPGLRVSLHTNYSI